MMALMAEQKPVLEYATPMPQPRLTWRRMLLCFVIVLLLCLAGVFVSFQRQAIAERAARNAQIQFRASQPGGAQAPRRGITSQP